MSGLVRSVGRKNLKVFPKEIQNPLDRAIDKKSQKVRFGPKTPPPEPVVPIPDEEALEQERKRRRSRRAGARAATVLTGGDSDTVG
jgi:hypothetical protein